MIYLVISKSKLLLTVTVQIYYWLMLFTHRVGDKIYKVQINIPFSFLDVLCCPVLSVLFLVGFQEVTVPQICNSRFKGSSFVET